MKNRVLKSILLLVSLMLTLKVQLLPVYASDINQETYVLENMSEEAFEHEADISHDGIPKMHIFLFCGGMVIAVGSLIFMNIRKKHRESDESDYDEEE